MLDILIGLGNEPLDIAITFPIIFGNLINNARAACAPGHYVQKTNSFAAHVLNFRTVGVFRTRENVCRMFYQCYTHITHMRKIRYARS